MDKVLITYSVYVSTLILHIHVHCNFNDVIYFVYQYAIKQCSSVFTCNFMTFELSIGIIN